MKFYVEDEKIIELDVEGFVEIIVGDILIDSDIEIVNFDYYFFIIVEGYSLKVIMIVVKNWGYVLVEGNKKDDVLVGILVVDLIYILVKKVNY